MQQCQFRMLHKDIDTHFSRCLLDIAEFLFFICKYIYICGVVYFASPHMHVYARLLPNIIKQARNQMIHTTSMKTQWLDWRWLRTTQT